MRNVEYGGMKFLVRENGRNPEKTLPRPHFVHHETQNEWPRRELGTPKMGGQRLTACVTGRPLCCFIYIGLYTYLWGAYGRAPNDPLSFMGALLIVLNTWGLFFCAINIYPPNLLVVVFPPVFHKIIQSNLLGIFLWSSSINFPIYLAFGDLSCSILFTSPFH